MPDYAQILSRRYPDLIWKMSGNDLNTLIILNGGVAPSQSELDALWPSVESEINSEKELLNRDQLFQIRYPAQNQIIECIRAIISGDTSVIQGILNTWESL